MERLQFTLYDIFDEVQRCSGSHQRNNQELTKLYNRTPFEDFSEAFTGCLEMAFTVDHTLKSANVKRFIEFSTYFVATLDRRGTNGITVDDDEEGSTHPFIRRVITKVLERHNMIAVCERFYSCQFIKCLLNSIGEDAILDNDICDDIQDAMLQRLQDPQGVIRSIAVLVLHRLQSPLEEFCPVVRAFILSLLDPCALVRQSVVQVIAPTKVTITKIVENVCDINHAVRSATYMKCSAIQPNLLKIVDRQFLCANGLRETNPAVRRIFVKVFLPKWLEAYGGNFLKFFEAIKLDANEEDIVTTAELINDLMEEFLKNHSIENILSFLPLDDNKLVREGELCSEVASYWSILQGQMLKSEAHNELLQVVVPELISFCNYIEKFMIHKAKEQVETWQSLEHQFVLLKLFEMASKFDMSEEVGRKKLHWLVCDTLTNRDLSKENVSQLVSILHKLSENLDSLIECITEISTNIKEPYVDVQPSEDEIRKQNFAIAELNVRLNILNDELEEAVKGRDLQLAATKEIEYQTLLTQKEQLTAANDAPKQVRRATDDLKIELKGLEILRALLELPEVEKMNTVLSCFKNELVSNMEKPMDIEIYRSVYKCCILYSIIDEACAQEFLKMFCTPIILYRTMSDYDKPTLIMAVHCFSDLLRLYGPELFIPDTDEGSKNGTVSNLQSKRKLYRSSETSSNCSIATDLSVEILFDILVSMLDDEHSDVRDAAGASVSHLLYHGIMVTPGFLSRILLKWFNPLTSQQNPKMYKLFGIAIWHYASNIHGSEYTLEKTVIPTLTVLAEAPKTSPLADIKVDHVITLLCHLTSIEKKNGIVSSHKILAHSLCTKIESNIQDKSVPILLKMLTILDVTLIDKAGRAELKIQIEDILEQISSKMLKNKLTKFLNEVNSELDVTNSNLRLETINENSSVENVDESGAPTTAASVEIAGNAGNDHGKRKIGEPSDLESEESPNDSVDRQVPVRKKRKGNSKSDQNKLNSSQEGEELAKRKMREKNNGTSLEKATLLKQRTKKSTKRKRLGKTSTDSESDKDVPTSGRSLSKKRKLRRSVDTFKVPENVSEANSFTSNHVKANKRQNNNGKQTANIEGENRRSSSRLSRSSVNEKEATNNGAKSVRNSIRLSETTQDKSGDSSEAEQGIRRSQRSASRSESGAKGVSKTKSNGARPTRISQGYNSNLDSAYDNDVSPNYKPTGSTSAAVRNFSKSHRKPKKSERIRLRLSRISSRMNGNGTPISKSIEKGISVGKGNKDKRGCNSVPPSRRDKKDEESVKHSDNGLARAGKTAIDNRSIPPGKHKKLQKSNRILEHELDSDVSVVRRSARSLSRPSSDHSHLCGCTAKDTPKIVNNTQTIRNSIRLLQRLENTMDSLESESDNEESMGNGHTRSSRGDKRGEKSVSHSNGRLSRVAVKAIENSATSSRKSQEKRKKDTRECDSDTSVRRSQRSMTRISVEPLQIIEKQPTKVLNKVIRMSVRLSEKPIRDKKYNNLENHSNKHTPTVRNSKMPSTKHTRHGHDYESDSDESSDNEVPRYIQNKISKRAGPADSIIESRKRKTSNTRNGDNKKSGEAVKETQRISMRLSERASRLESEERIEETATSSNSESSSTIESQYNSKRSRSKRNKHSSALKSSYTENVDDLHAAKRKSKTNLRPGNTDLNVSTPLKIPKQPERLGPKNGLPTTRAVSVHELNQDAVVVLVDFNLSSSTIQGLNETHGSPGTIVLSKSRTRSSVRKLEQVLEKSPAKSKANQNLTNQKMVLVGKKVDNNMEHCKLRNRGKIQSRTESQEVSDSDDYPTANSNTTRKERNNKNSRLTQSNKRKSVSKNILDKKQSKNIEENQRQKVAKGGNPRKSTRLCKRK